MSELPNIDVNDLDPNEYQVLKSRAGQARLQAFAEALGSNEEEEAAMTADDLIAILGGAFSQSLSEAETARLIRARLPDKRWAAFARARFDEVTALLKQAAASQPQLASPRARTFVLAVQDALRDPDGAEVVVAWLVRAAGPGFRGESLRLTRPRTVIGTGPSCQLRIEDQYLSKEHLAISEAAGAFAVQVLQGAIKVEGRTITGERTLMDGETLEFGQGQYIFKAVVDG